MSRPIIGITTGRRNEAAEAGVRASPVAGIPMAYPQAVQRSGGAPVLLPRCDDREVIDAAVARIDALLLTGGGADGTGNQEPGIRNEEPGRTLC